MERDVWRWIARGLRRLPRRWPTHAVYDNRQILALLLWAALHDRPVSWACRRSSWPVQAWRRRLPDQSTMSRRLRDPSIIEDLVRLLAILQQPMEDESDLLIVDGKPLPVSEYTNDPEASTAWGVGRHQRGYKLHVLIDGALRLVAWDVRPMNTAECVVARDLVQHAAAHDAIRPHAVMLGDASYDSNPLHAAAAAAGVQLIAPRRKAHRSISCGHHQHPGRLASIELTENDPVLSPMLRGMRQAVERYLGALATVGGGLSSLPAWTRRLVRVRFWVGAKLAIHAARAVRRKEVHA